MFVKDPAALCLVPSDEYEQYLKIITARLLDITIVTFYLLQKVGPSEINKTFAKITYASIDLNNRLTIN